MARGGSSQHELDLIRLLERDALAADAKSSSPHSTQPLTTTPRPRSPSLVTTTTTPSPQRHVTPAVRRSRPQQSPRARKTNKQRGRYRTTPRPIRQARPSSTASPIPRLPRRWPAATQRPRVWAPQLPPQVQRSPGRITPSRGTPRLAIPPPSLQTNSPTLPPLIFLTSPPPLERRERKGVIVVEHLSPTVTQTYETSSFTTPSPTEPTIQTTTTRPSATGYKLYTLLTTILCFAVLYFLICSTAGCYGGFYITR